MKTVLLAVSLLLAASAMASGAHNNEEHQRYTEHNVKTIHPRYKKQERHFARVISSRPIYKNVTTYRTCPPHAKPMFVNGGQHLTLSSSVPGAVVYAAFGKPHQREQHCKKVVKRFVGYKNVAYWHGRKIVEISQRPLKRVRVDLNDRYAQR